MKQVKMGIEGLDCANCAAKLEREITKIEGLKNVSINFMQEKLLFECEEEQLDNMIHEIEEVIERVEPEASLVKGSHHNEKEHHHDYEHSHSCGCGHEHHHHEYECGEDHHSHCDHECNCQEDHESSDKKIQMKISGLDCANCAAKLEREIAKIEGLKNVSINFMQEKLLFECEEERLDEMIHEIEEVIERVEPEASLEKNQAHHSHHHEHDSHCECHHEHHHNHDHHEHHHDHKCGCGHDHGEHHYDEQVEDHRVPVGKIQMLVKGLDCANCAAQLEREIAKIDHLKNVQLIFMNETLSFDVEQKYYDEAISNIRKTIQRVEPDCTLEEKKSSGQNKKETKNHRSDILKIVGSILFLVGAQFLKSPINLICYLVSYLLVGYPVLKTAIRNMGKGQWMDENFLMALATVGAIGTGEFAEGVFVMLLYQIGELLQAIAVENSRRSISELMNIRADEANVKLGDRIEKMAVEEVNVGDIIVIRPGEKVPLDGVVLNGASSLNTAALTGESLPRDVSVNDEVISGCVNMQGLLEVRVTKTSDESTVSKILDLVENSSNRKAHAENFITTFARVYTPSVVALACIIAFICPLIIPSADFWEYFHRGLIFLVVSCPCALVISVPLTYFAGIGGLSKKGILVKGSNYLDALNAVDTVVFDKTGTITKGEFFVSEVKSEIEEERLIEYCAYAESNSTHPISKAIVKAYGKTIDSTKIESVNELAGHGVEAQFDHHVILAGNSKLMRKNGIEFEETATQGTAVYVAIDGKYSGVIIINDQIKPTAKQAIRDLKTIGIKKTVILSGDNNKSVSAVAQECGINEVHGELLPTDKVEAFEKLNQHANCAYVGDGINDAPVLALANVGLAMGGLGSDAAIEAADVVIMNDDLMLINDAIKGAKKTRRIVMQNIIFSLLVKAFILVLSAIGQANMGLAIFADVGVMLLAVFNAIRALK